MKKYIKTVRNGFSALSDSAKGQYSYRSEMVKELRKEMFSGESSFKKDRNNLAGDGKKVAEDIRKSYNRLITQNV
jgi:hypothetical protein